MTENSFGEYFRSRNLAQFVCHKY